MRALSHVPDPFGSAIPRTGNQFVTMVHREIVQLVDVVLRVRQEIPRAGELGSRDSATGDSFSFSGRKVQASGKGRSLQMACNRYPRSIFRFETCPHLASGSFEYVPTGNGLPSITRSRPGMAMPRASSSNAVRKAFTDGDSRRRLNVESDGSLTGFKRVDLQFHASHAQCCGRSWRQAQKKTKTITASLYRTPPRRDRFPTFTMSAYNAGQSSHSMADLLPWGVTEPATLRL
jgi:hypothetical protein